MVSKRRTEPSLSQRAGPHLQADVESHQKTPGAASKNGTQPVEAAPHSEDCLHNRRCSGSLGHSLTQDVPRPLAPPMAMQQIVPDSQSEVSSQ